MKTVAFLRVSTRSQDLANQKLAILEWLDLKDPEPAPRHRSLPEVRRGGQVVDIERLRQPKLADDER